MPIKTNELRALRRFGEHLRSIREGVKVTQTAAARHLSECLNKRVTQDRISYIERGRGWPGADELPELLKLYGVNKANRLVMQQMMADGQAADASWWDEYRAHMSQNLAQLVDYENTATHIFMASSSAIPGLLQNRATTEALLQFDMRERGSATTEALIEVRQRRGIEIFERATPAPHVTAVFTEGVLRTEVGGREILRQQLDHLLYLAAKPQVTLQILHYGSGAAAALCGTFSILDYGGTRPATSHSDVDGGVFFEERKSEVAKARARFQILLNAALVPEKSFELIENIRKGM